MKDILQAAVKKTATLYSIFDRVDLKKEGHQRFKEDRRSKLDPAKLTPDGLARKEGFPVLSEKDLEADLALLEQNLHELAHTDTLPYLFQKYGWRITAPDAPEKYPDEAFSDRYRAVQALAKPGSSGGYLLVKGDLTGIQEYIYHNIQAGKTGGLSNLTKRLRYRSILVSLLTDFIANVILRELGLSSWHLLFAGGGHFNLLLPADPDTQVHLKMTAESLDKSMRAQFGDRLELIVAHVEVKSREELEKNASRYFEEVNAERDRKKCSQHRKDLADLFERPVEKGKKKEIRIGGLFPRQHYLLEIVSKEPLRYFEPEDERDYRGDLILAEFAPNAHHTLLAVKSMEDAKKFLLKNKAEKGQRENIQSALILALNDTDFLPQEDWKSDFDFPASFGFRFLGKNAPVDDNDEILDFSELAGKDKNSPKSDGFVRLGSLMLDVDNLGIVFSHGLGKDATLAQIITLSREMNYFFTAHFDQRARENNVYVVYSGGDDAFAVGKWDMLMRFAKTLREDFQKFIRYEDNGNPNVHFSAGIFMSNPHYPLGRFYKDTKSLQERAKETESKNCVDIFDYTLSWDSYEDKFELGNQFKEVLEKGQTASGRKFNSSFAYRIMQLVKGSYYERDEWVNGELHRRGRLRPDKFARNIARMHYLFARNGFSAEDSQKITDDLEKHLMHSFLKNAMKPEDSGKFEARDYLVALNFAMLQVRSKI